jgi:hypothetical protein
MSDFVQQENDLVLYTIYEKPTDYPDHFVVRKYFVRGGETFPSLIASTFDTLASARLSLPAGLCCVGRMSGDHPHIVETWL